MKFSLKRTLSLLLVLLLLVGLMPTIALAEDPAPDTTPPTISLENGKTYCVGTAFTVEDNVGVVSVTIGGTAATDYKLPSTPADNVEIVVKDAAGNTTTVTVTVAGHSFTNYVSNNNATCTADGTKTAKCDRCDVTDTVVDIGSKLGHTLEKVPEQPATCLATGVKEHWKCKNCGNLFSDENGTIPTTLEALTIEKIAHTVELVPEKKSTCLEKGVKEHYECTVCHTFFEDAAGTKVITDTTTLELPLGEHTIVLVRAKAPTCATAGNYRHYQCSVCKKLFLDAQGKTETTEKAVTIPATGKHTWSRWIIGSYPTELRNGWAYRKCTVCDTQLDYAILTWRDFKPALPFVDVDTTDSYYDAVSYVYANGLMKGTSDNRFSPARSFDRGMVAMILYRLEGRPSVKYNDVFPDVARNDWYADCISWAYKYGVLKGYNDGSVRPNDPVTVEQLLTILYRYAESEGYRVTGRGSVDRYYDADDISSYALKAVRWAVSADLISGRGYLGPKSNASRAEVAEILMNFCKNVLNYK